MRSSRWAAAAFLVGVTVVVVSAQQPGGGRNNFRQSAAQMILTNTALQEEVKLSDSQKEKLKGLAEKQQAAMKERFGSFKDLGGDKEKLKAAFAEFQKENEARQKEAEALLTPEQKTRLQQIDRQLAGVRAFTDDALVADLKLNDSQKTKIKGIVDEYTKDSQGLGGFGGFGGKGGFDKEKAAEAAKKREKLTKGALADIDEVLTDDQRKSWKSLTGDPVDVAKIRQGGFGGGFGGFGKGGNKNKTKD
jgi:hypothetical protein